MTSVPAQPTAQLGGVSHVFFVEHRLVATWPPVVAGKQLGTHQLRPGQLFGQLAGIFATPELTTEASDTLHGAQYQQLVGGEYAGDSPEVTAQLARMHGKRYLVLVRYRNGTIVAAGDQLSGLLFTSKLASGRTPKERKGRSWQFEGATSTPAVYLTQPFSVEGLGLVTPQQPVPTAGSAAGGSGTVPIYSSRGRLLGVATVGQRIVITSPFKATVNIQ
jgi:hypothetical protein